MGFILFKNVEGPPEAEREWDCAAFDLEDGRLLCDPDVDMMEDANQERYCRRTARLVLP